MWHHADSAAFPGTSAAARNTGGDPIAIGKALRSPPSPAIWPRCATSRSRDFLLDLRREGHEDLRQALLLPRLERTIGVIYRPESELASHYFEASLPNQFDRYVWFEETAAAAPLSAETVAGAPETFSFAL
ncbi:MAG TPA: erythromycin esterase family protein [Kiloniellaceae bacterium]